MRLPKYFVFPRKLMIFFFTSHVLSYIVSTIQTIWIVSETKKSKKGGE